MIQLELQPELEAQLAAEAEAAGLPLPELIQNIILKRFLGTLPDIAPRKASAVD